MPQTFGPYEPLRRAGQLVFTAGQIGVDPATKLVQPDIANQTARALENLKEILEAEGFTMNDVVKTTVFLTSMDDFAAMNDVYMTFFEAPRPARSTVAVKDLPHIGETELLVEIEAIASHQS